MTRARLIAAYAAAAFGFIALALGIWLLFQLA
jgi:hypothetical protein